jgi:hypothetical protein
MLLETQNNMNNKKIEKNIDSLLLKDHVNQLWNYIKIENQELHTGDVNFDFEGSTNVQVYNYEIQTERIERRNEFLNLPIINSEYAREIKSKNDDGYDYDQCVIDNVNEIKLSERFKYKTICIGYVLKDTEFKEVRFLTFNIIIFSDFVWI